MVHQPTQDEIQNLIDFSGVTHEQARILLQKHDGDTQRAMNDWFDNGERALSWEPPGTEWTKMDNVSSFQIDATDTANSSIRGAASRPPSRASYRQNEIIDLTDAHAAADISKGKSWQDDLDAQDPDLQRALAISRGEVTSPQENGITGLGQQFGPAQAGKQYEPSQWGMTYSGQSTTRDVVEHPRPSKRRRISGEPAFLRGSTETRYLAPLLTIYHAIPLAREALLFPPLEVHAYGSDPNWWCGTSDENYKSVSIVNPGQSTEKENVICEIQTLMAFLDASKRAYGSVDSLADLQGFKNFPAEKAYTRLLDVWKSATMSHSPEEQLTQVFNSLAMKDIGYPNADPVSKDFHCLDPPVHPKADGDHTIYEVLDANIWDDPSSETLDDVWLRHCSEILTLRLYDPFQTKKDGKDAPLCVRIPAILYTDRYLEEYRAYSWNMRTALKEMDKYIIKLNAQQLKLQSVDLPGRGQQNVRQVLEAAKEATAIAMKDKSLQTNGVHDDIEMQPLLAGLSQGQIQQCVSDIQSVIDRFSRKIARLEEQKNAIREQMRRASAWLTTPSRREGESPVHKYYLSGVSTKPWITYVRIKKDKSEDLIDLEGDGEGSGAKIEDVDDEDEADWDWWRISFSRDDVPTVMTETSHPPMLGPMTQQQQVEVDMARKVRQLDGGADAVGYSIRKVREYEVLKAAKEDSNECVCVYASQKAIRFKGSAMSDALKAFVDRDNLAFEGEMRVERREEIERQSQSESTDVQEGEFEDIQLDPSDGMFERGGAEPPPGDISNVGELSRQMTPMSMSSPKREAEDHLEEGRMSPKRPRSSGGLLGVDGESEGVETPTVGARSDVGDGEPPPYEEGGEFGVYRDGSGHEMQEKISGVFLGSGGSRIGEKAERMMERFGGDGDGKSEREGKVEIEHPNQPLR